MNGFFQLQRRFFSHWLWTEESRVFSKAEAFLDLLQLAAFTRSRRVVGGSVIQLEPGQVCGSERYLAGRWGWSTKKVRAFLTLLEAERMVERQKKREGSILTLCNYEKYRNEGGGAEAPKNQRGSTKEAPRKQIEEGKEGGEGKEPSLGAEASRRAEERDRCMPEKWRNLPKAARSSVKVRLNTEPMQRISRWFNRREGTRFTVDEAEAFFLLEIEEGDMDTLEAWYLASDVGDRDIRRRDLVTLLRHWSIDLDRARLWKTENP